MKEDQKRLEEALVRLCKNTDFADYLAIIRDMRESAIDGMEGANTERLHQISGAISVYNAILNNAKVYAALERRDKKQE